MKGILRFSAVLLVFGCCFVDSARILGLFHFPVRSQHVLGSYLLKELAARGHEVTMISPYPFDTPVANYTDIKVDNGLLNYMKDTLGSMLGGKQLSMFQRITTIPQAFQDFGRIYLDSPEIKELLANPNNKFDLVIQLWNMNEAFLGIGHHFNAPTIAFCTVGASTMINHAFGNPSPYAMVPNLFVASTEKFLDRVLNVFAGFTFDMVLRLKSLPLQKQLLAKHFPKAPSLEELVDGVNIALMNSHPAVEGSKPYMPNMIQIGGFYLEKPDPLPKDLRQFIEDSKDGVVLFSLGSNVKTATFPPERVAIILDALKKLKQRVIFKFDAKLDNLPSNVMMADWLPQTSILAHENVKLFVTHAGLGGVAEGIYNAVPMVCIPFFGDQLKNCADIERNGYSVRLLLGDLSVDSLYEAMTEVLTNPKYKKKLDAVSDFYKSQPIKPLEKAIFWVEHVLKHKGASHFPKSPGSNLPLYQYLLLDILAFFVVILLAIYFVLRTLARLICKKLFGCNNKTASKTTSTKSKKKN